MSGIFYQDFPCSGATDAPVLVLLHGWGMHSGVWEAFLPLLTPHARVRCIDLPGFGRSAGLPVPTSLESMTGVLQDVAPAQSIWVGWSLGGLLAMEMASRFPLQVSRLVLIAATPCFVERDDWPVAMPAQEFSAFAESVRRDAASALTRFLVLQCQGSVSVRQDLRYLQSCMAQGMPASSEALQQGLALLGNSDCRARVSELSVPVLCLLGQKDALVPASVASAPSFLPPSSVVRVVEGAAHAPFLSHPTVCANAVRDFIGARS